MELHILEGTFTLVAATEKAIANLDLSQYERVTVALENTGANPVTAASWGEGVASSDDAITAPNGTVGSAVQAALTAGDSSVTVLTGNDIPSQFALTLTSTLGTTIKAIVKGVAKGTDLFPVS